MSEKKYVGIKQATLKGYAECEIGGVADFLYPTSKLRRGRVQGNGQISPTITAENTGVCKVEENKDFNWDDTEYRIRKITPREAGRLMDVEDKDIDKMAFVKKEIKGDDLECFVKLRDVEEKPIHTNTETYVLCITNDLVGMDAIFREEKNEKKQLKSEKKLNVNIVMMKSVNMEQEECVVDITKCLDSMEMLYMLTKKIERCHMAIIGLVKEDNTNTEKYMKITSEENLSPKKLYIILTLLKQITESKIFTSTLVSVSICGHIANIESCENNMVRVQISDLKMECTYTRISSTQLYKQFGNSIVVSVLCAVYSQLNIQGIKPWNERTIEEKRLLTAIGKQKEPQS